MEIRKRQIESLQKIGLNSEEAELLIGVGIPTPPHVYKASDDLLEKFLGKARVKAIRDSAKTKREPKKPK